MTGLRVAFVAGTLGQGGAEVQLVRMAAGLQAAGVSVRVFSLRRGEHHVRSLRELGIEPVWCGSSPLPPVRAAVLAARMLPFRPHVVQAAHFYVNLYAAGAAAACRAVSIGAMRSDLEYERASAGRWTERLLHAPGDLIVNSWAAREQVASAGREPDRVHVIPNALALPGSEPAAAAAPGQAPSLSLGPGPIAIVVGSLSPVKRVDRFLHGLKAAQQEAGDLRGLIVGDGPQRGNLEAMARALGLGPRDVQFVGAQPDITPWLRCAAFLVLTSEHEGCPNAVLEAMQAELPVLATPVGDVPRLVAEGQTGFLLPADDVSALGSLMVRLAGDAGLRAQMGAAAGRIARGFEGTERLAEQLLAVYGRIASRTTSPRLRAALA
jgi:glycosyltransferase involved in cell wall biosynthesis